MCSARTYMAEVASLFVTMFIVAAWIGCFGDPNRSNCLVALQFRDGGTFGTLCDALCPELLDVLETGTFLNSSLKGLKYDVVGSLMGTASAS